MSPTISLMITVLMAGEDNRLTCMAKAGNEGVTAHSKVFFHCISLVAVRLVKIIIFIFY